jgi:hypothetical protein
MRTLGPDEMGHRSRNQVSGPSLSLEAVGHDPVALTRGSLRHLTKCVLFRQHRIDRLQHGPAHVPAMFIRYPIVA